MSFPVSKKRAELWNELTEKNFVTGDVPAYEKIESPWYVRILIGFSGWISALFMLAFIGTAFEFVINNKSAALIVGSIMIIAAYKLLTTKSDSDFLSQFALAVSFAGQALLIYSLELIQFSSVRDGGNWLLLAVIQAVLAWFMPNSTHRVWSAFIAIIAINIALTVWHIYFIQTAFVMAIVAIIWLNEFKWIGYHEKLKAIGYGVTLALLYQVSSGIYYLIFSSSTRNPGSAVQSWGGDLLSGAVILFVVLELLRRYSILIPSRVANMAFIGAVILILVSLKMFGITAGVMIILLGYANGNRILSGLGIASLIYYISAYYYFLNTTLLEKSQLLAVFGLILLLASGLMRRVLFKDKEEFRDQEELRNIGETEDAK